ncbi:MAG TPA: hypothetical protein VJP88_00325 [Caulobacteraceae bacterium]|nr:hypothetical protein [Caulobacteraceae bacterium]
MTPDDQTAAAASTATPARAEPPRASLVEFERAVVAGDHVKALTQAQVILDTIDRGRGSIEAIDAGPTNPNVSARDRHIRFATRFAAAYGELMTRPSLPLSGAAVEVLFAHHRWADNLFAISGFQTSDHLMTRFGEGRENWRLSGGSLIPFLATFSPSSLSKINFDECLKVSHAATVLAALGYLSARVCVTAQACAFRDQMLEWLPGKLEGVTLGATPLQRVTEIYAHCSYAATPGKHRIKADLVAQVRRACLAAGAVEFDPKRTPPKDRKPRIVIITELYAQGHAIHRTHSRAVRSLREKFEVIGVCHGQPHAPDVRDCFDEVIVFPAGGPIAAAAALSQQIFELQPDIVFFLGVGLTGHAIALASLRTAGVQLVSYGHTATTMSPTIDYMVLPEDFVGDPACFSEKLLLLPPAALPYAPARMAEATAVQPLADKDPLRIAVPASVMKINAAFLNVLARIAAGAKRPVEFHFFPLGAVGVAHLYIEQEIKRRLPGAQVHGEQPHPDYLRALATCAFFVCPFPYGNMNSIVDAVSLGLPGVCLDGPEAHSHADVAIFARLGLPKALATRTVDDYVAAALRLINERPFLEKSRKAAAACDLEQRFYSGDERLFCEAIYKLLPA